MLTALLECSNNLTSPQKNSPILFRSHLQLSIWAGSLRDICVKRLFQRTKAASLPWHTDASIKPV